MFDLSKTKFKAIIFDCDGTIVNNMPLHYKAWVHALKSNGASFDLHSSEILKLAGKGIHEIVDIFNNKYQQNLNPDLVSATKDKFFSEHEHEVGIIKEIEEIILKYKGKLPMSVASGSRTHSVIQSLSHVGLSNVFDHIVTVDDVINGKPSPEMFLLASEKMNVQPTDCIVFEDGELGIQAAKACNMTWFRVESRL